MESISYIFCVPQRVGRRVGCLKASGNVFTELFGSAFVSCVCQLACGRHFVWANALPDPADTLPSAGKEEDANELRTAHLQP